MPHNETASATGHDKNIVMAFTSGVLKSQIFTGSGHHARKGTEWGAAADKMARER
jgi:hypothetical protein